MGSMKRVWRARARVGVLAGAMALTAAAGTAQGQTLREAMALAYTDNPTLQAQRALVRATDEQVPQALAGWRPTVTLTGEAGRERADGNAGFGGPDYRNFNALTLTLTQNVFDAGKTRAEVDAAEATVRAARARLAETEQSVLLNVVTAYTNVVREQAVVELNRQNLERLRRQLEATSDRFEVGEVTRTDVAQAESRVAEAEADVIAAQGDLEVSRALFEQVVGVAPGRLQPESLIVTLPASQQDAVNQAVEANPAVTARLFDRRSAERSIASETADLLPSVDVRARASDSRTGGRLDQDRENLELAAVLTVPIYQAGAASSQVREAKQNFLRAGDLIDEARRAATETAASAWQNLQTSLARIEALRANVTAAEIALEGVEQEAAVGSRTVLDVLDAEQELLDAQVALVRAQRDVEVARADLVAAIGGLTAGELDLPVEIYDDVEYYNEVRDQWWGLGSDVTSAPESAPLGQ